MTRLSYAIAFSALDRDFAVEIADTAAALQDAQALRYEVFCRERNILPDPTGTTFEADRFDDDAHHVLLRRRADGEVVGTTRLVTLPPGETSPAFPMQRYCALSIFQGMAIERLGEVSRFALSTQRRTPGTPSDSLLRLGLMRGILKVSRELGLTHWCALMEPSLLRLLQSSGVRFVPRGPIVEAYGLRQPCFAQISAVLSQGEEQCPEFHAFVTRDVVARHTQHRESVAA